MPAGRDSIGSETTRRAALALLGAGALGAPVLSSCGQELVGQAQEVAQTTLTLRFCDAQGREMGLEAVRRVQSNRAGQEGYDDALLDSTTLEVLDIGPLYQSKEGRVCVDVPADRACTLTMSWPTSHGYSALLVDLPASGSVEVLEAAARGLHERQEVRASQDQQAEEAVRSARQSTQAALSACAAATAQADKGRQAFQALELAAAAQLSLDDALAATAPADSLLGVTFTRPPRSQEVQDLAQRLGGEGRTGVRIVIDDSSDTDAMASWTRTVTVLQAQGVRVVGQICDSYDMADYDDDTWDAHVNTLLTALPDLDVWEVGNELGGDWLGPDALSRTVRAAKQVRARTSAKTLLTFYYQLGLATAEHSLFNTVRQVADSELAGLVDVVGLSVYPQWHPLGTAADRILSTLAAAFPSARVGVTELGYGGPRLGGPWWFGSRTDVAAGRRAVAKQVTSAALGRPGAWGAPFWWYYLEDEAPGAAGGPVQETLSQVVG